MAVLIWIVTGVIVGLSFQDFQEMTGKANPQNSKDQKFNLETSKTVYIAVVGALLAGWLVTIFTGLPTLISFNLFSVGAPLIGAILMLWLRIALSVNESVTFDFNFSRMLGRLQGLVPVLLFVSRRRRFVEEKK